MPPPTAAPAELPVSVLLVTTAVPPSLAIAPPALVLVLPVSWVPVTVRFTPLGPPAARPVPGQPSPPAQRRIRVQTGRTAAAALWAIDGWPFCPLRIPPPSPPLVLPVIVLLVTVTRPGTLCRPPFCIPPPPNSGAVLSLTVLPVTVSVPPAFAMPPPAVAVFLLITLRLTVSLPALYTPPPYPDGPALPPVIVTRDSVAVAAFATFTVRNDPLAWMTVEPEPVPAMAPVPAPSMEMVLPVRSMLPSVSR